MKTLSQLENQKTLIDSLSKYSISIGVMKINTVREKTEETTEIEETAKIGLTNAELMFIHENGSPMRNIPSRPVLEMTIQWAQSQIDSVLNECVEGIFDGWTRTKLEQHLNRFCVRMENYARDIIMSNDGRLKANSPEVAKKKKGNHPLFDTGDLTRSITAVLEYS
jgi:hypothetical protein